MKKTPPQKAQSQVRDTEIYGRMKDLKVGWGDGSTVTVFAIQSWGPEFYPQHLYKKPGSIGGTLVTPVLPGEWVQVERERV